MKSRMLFSNGREASSGALKALITYQLHVFHY
jgi:hypothetical protein